jgi:hypothetical protein
LNCFHVLLSIFWQLLLQPTAPPRCAAVITAALQALGANVEQSSECKGSARIRS